MMHALLKNNSLRVIRFIGNLPVVGKSSGVTVLRGLTRSWRLVRRGRLASSITQCV